MNSATLLIDADDTLWENIVVFNAVNQSYVDWLMPGRTLAEMQRELDAHQVKMITEHGYGRDTFRLSLISGIEHFGGRNATEADIARIDQLVAPLQWDTLELIDGVPETLAWLAQRHRLVLVTKGDPTEQNHKIEQSGLRQHFDAVAILAQKSPAEYRQLIADQSLDPATTWMIGNSPRSDILPALDVGLGAVHIPHFSTWSHEHAALEPHPRLVNLRSFRELLHQFADPN